MRPVVLFAFSSFLFVCVGCGVSGDAVPTANDAISGVLMGGQQPISGATVTVYQAGTSGYGQGATAMASTTTSATGSFGFAANAYTCSSANAPMYLVATSGNPGSGTNNSVAQMAIIGPCTAGRSSYFAVSEVSTAAAAIVLAPYMNTTLGSGVVPQVGATCSDCASGVFNKGLVAAMTKGLPAIFNPQTGNAQVTRTSSGVTITTESAKLYSIANVLAACVNSTGSTSTTETTTTCGKLFTDVNATSASPRPYTTLQAALMMALYPYYNVSTVFNLQPSAAPFTGLSTTPTDWTLAVSYASSAYGLGVNTGSSSTISIDASGNVWFPTTTSSSHGLAYFNPSTTAFAGPYVTGLTHPQYVAVDNNTTTKVWANDMSVGKLGSVSASSPTTAGTLYATGDGTTLTSTGPMFVDNAGNVAFSGVNGTSSTNYVVLSGGTSSKSVGGSKTFQAVPTGYAGYTGTEYGDYGYAVGIGGSSSGECYGEYMIGGSPDAGSTIYTATAANTTTTCYSGGVAFAYVSSSQWDYFGAATTANMICSKNTSCASFAIGMSSPQGMALDGANRLWIANSGNASVSMLKVAFNSDNSQNYSAITSVALQHGTSHGATATTPYGIAVDGSGNVWLSNAGCTTTSCTPGSFVLTEIFGAATPTITPLSNVSKNTLYNTRPTS